MNIELKIDGINCAGCVKKIEKTLHQLEGVTSAEVSLVDKTAQVSGSASSEQLIEALQQIGKPATVLRVEQPSSQQYQLSIPGINCAGCVKKIETTLQQLTGVKKAEVYLADKTAWVEGSISDAELLSSLQQIGKPAEIISGKATTSTASDSATHELYLSIPGLSCAGCIKKVEATLQQLPGVSEAQANLSDKSARVISSLSCEEILQTLDGIGKPASVIPMQGQNANQQILLNIPKITCAGCVRNVEKTLLAVSGVEKAEVSLAEKSATITGRASLADLLSALEQINKPGSLANPAEENRRKQQQENQQQVQKMFRSSWLALSIGVPLMLWGLITGNMSVNSAAEQVSWGIIGILTLAVMYFSGSHFFKGAWNALKHQDASMDTLIALGTGSAWLYSILVVLFPDFLPEQSRHLYFEASAMIIGLVNLGHAMELRARGKTGQAIERLFKLQAKTARIVDSLDADAPQREVPIEQVIPGQLVLVKPGESIAVDGQVLSGDSWINEAMLTGEPMEIHKFSGEQVSAGTLNGKGSLIFRAEKVGNETALARIIEMVRRAQNSKLPIAKMADTIAGYFVPAVMLIAITAALIWFNFGPEPQLSYMLTAVVTVLIIACPCALGLATPMSVIVGVGKAAELGMLVRNGEALQSASKITHVLLDKTGTITQGKPELVQLHNFSQSSDQELLQLAASAEALSEHPLANAIVSAAKEQKLAFLNTQQFQSYTGLGITAQVTTEQQTRMLSIGSEKLLEKHAINITAEAQQLCQQMAESGETPIFIAIDNQLAALAGIADPIRQDSLAAIQRLHQMDIQVVMVTGDAQTTAKAVAKKARVDQVFARQLPENKADVVKQLQQQGHVVAMCGDGINDAPALAQANVSFAIGTGADIANDAADITLMRDSLHSLTDAIELSRATISNIKQNLLGAFAYNSLGIPVAAGVLYPVAGILLSPVIAGMAMAFSSFTVVSNAARLKYFKPSSHSESL